jgi:hypothetical protein
LEEKFQSLQSDNENLVAKNESMNPHQENSMAREEYDTSAADHTVVKQMEREGTIEKRMILTTIALLRLD